MPDLSEHSPAYGVETIAQALLNIYREVVDVEGGIEPNLYQETRRIFSEAVADGWVKASDRDIPTPDQAFRDAFLHSADVFSAFRVHRMQKDIAAQMIDSNGNVKPFRKFVKDVSPYIEHRNREWLQTEYNTAILRAQNAAEWQQFMAEKDVFPNLEWIPSTSPNPGEDHRVFWGTVRPVDDAFWNVHKPGDRWNCKCELRQTEKAVTPVPTSRAKAIDNAAKGLESNPAKDKEVFSDKHPYYPKNCSICPFAGNKLMALVHDLAGGKDCHHCRRVDNIIRQESHQENRIGPNISIAEFVHNKLKRTINEQGQETYQKTIKSKNGDIIIFRRNFFEETLSKCIRKRNKEETMQFAFEFQKWAKKMEFVRTEAGRDHNCEFRVYEVIYKEKRIELKAKDTIGFIAHLIRVYNINENQPTHP